MSTGIEVGRLARVYRFSGEKPSPAKGSEDGTYADLIVRQLPQGVQISWSTHQFHFTRRQAKVLIDLLELASGDR